MRPLTVRAMKPCGLRAPLAQQRLCAARSALALVLGQVALANADALGGDFHQLVVLDEFHRVRSEEHTSELQSQSNLVCRLLLEKKKKRENIHNRDVRDT